MGWSLPITETSISLAFIAFSTRILRSYLQASTIAFLNSSLLWAFVIPTEEPELTVLQFELKCDTQGLEEQDDFRLYRNEDGEFVDITPADAGIKAVIQYYGHMITLYMQSSELGGLPAGDYRAEYGPYYVDFKMSEQQYVVD